MLRTISQTAENRRAIQLGGIVFFTLLTIISAKITIDIGPVPFTMQPFAVLLAGMVLGGREGAASQIAYVALIAGGLPVDARGLGTAALFGPTGGYLIGFIGGAFVAGVIVERAGERLWQRWLAGVAGIAVIYLFGVTHLSLYLGTDLGAAWASGAAPFIIPDLIKAFIAAGMVEGGRRFLSAR